MTSRTPQQQLSFLREVLKTTYQSQGDPQIVYSLLESQNNLLDEGFAQLLPNWAIKTFANSKPATAKALAQTIFTFSQLIEQFPQGNQLSNLAIAIAGYQTSLQFFANQHYLQEFTTTQAALAEAKEKRQQLLEGKLPPLLPVTSYPPQKIKKKGAVYLSGLVEERSQILWSLAGYALLMVALIDCADILIPGALSDRWWQLQTIGRLVENAWVPLLGLIFIFYRREGYVARGEMYLLRCLSWGSLVVGLCYLLMVPVGINHALYLYKNYQVSTAVSIARPSQQPLQQTRTDRTLAQLTLPLNSYSPLSQIDRDLQEKDDSLSEVYQVEQNGLAHEVTILEDPQIMLWRNSVKWIFGCGLASAWFTIVWRLTRWARRFK